MSWFKYRKKRRNSARARLTLERMGPGGRARMLRVEAIERGDRYRSVPLARIEPLARVKAVKLFSLQKNHGQEQLACVPFADAITDLSPRLETFLDTAAVLENLDLLICCDTSLAHLAGALGLPVWVAVAFSPDWRWMLEREDTPWYPSMRLFRQRRPGDWPEVFERLAAALDEAVTGKRR
jgi:hypothetical protein